MKAGDVVVLCMGGAWLLSAKNYERMLRHIAESRDVNAADYGKQIANETVRLTDMSPIEAQERLDALEGK